jgi:hypothetical protein
VFGLFEGSAALKGQRRTIVALRATYELFPGLCEPRIRRAINVLGRRVPDRDLIFFFGLQRLLPQTWGFFEQDNQTRLTELVPQSSDDNAKLVLPICLEIAGLEGVCSARINALGYEQLGLLLQVSKHPMAIARAVDIYCFSRSWDQANAHYNHVIEPVLNELNQAQIRRILLASAVERADLNGAHSFTNFVKYVYDHEKLPREEIIATMRENNMEWLMPRVQAEPTADRDFPF